MEVLGQCFYDPDDYLLLADPDTAAIHIYYFDARGGPVFDNHVRAGVKLVVSAGIFVAVNHLPRSLGIDRVVLDTAARLGGFAAVCKLLAEVP